MQSTKSGHDAAVDICRASCVALPGGAHVIVRRVSKSHWSIGRCGRHKSGEGSQAPSKSRQPGSCLLHHFRASFHLVTKTFYPWPRSLIASSLVDRRCLDRRTLARSCPVPLVLVVLLGCITWLYYLVVFLGCITMYVRSTP